MRELLSKAAMRGIVTATNVDLFDYGLSGLAPNDINYLDTIAPGARDAGAAPRYIDANV